MTKIIDADGHIVEPRTFWQDYIEPRFRDRLPRIAKDSEGIDRIAVAMSEFTQARSHQTHVKQSKRQ
jgi:hypothetical protein